MRAPASLLIAGLLVAAGGDALARPGGGSSFRSSSSSYRSSSSSYRSSSSYGSSSSSSSSSSYSSSRVYAPPSPPRPDMIRVAPLETARRTWTPGAAPMFGPNSPRPPPDALSDDRRCIGDHDWAWWRRQLIGYGMTAVFCVVAVALMLLWLMRVGRAYRREWTTRAAGPARRQLEAIRRDDGDFSVVLFEDFLYNLYAEAHTARGQGKLDRLAPYLRPQARAALARLGTRPVSTVVVGSMQVLEVVHSGGWRVRVEFTTNYSETPPGGQPHSYYAVEQWTLERGPHARSRPPERVRALGCPSCAAPVENVTGSTCKHCGQVVDTGTFDWVVAEVVVQQREQQPPMLTGTAPEVGTDNPTIRDPALPALLQEIAARDPGVTEAALQQRVARIFAAMQQAWSTLRWDEARPYLSESLHHAQSYWIAAYRAQGLRNVTQNARVTAVEVVRATSDRWYDAVTVRVRATGLDYTLRDADGAVVGGSKERERPYSEYWTLIRSSKPPAPGGAQCPQCGAAVELGMGGHCGHCGARLSTAAFDWVLSRIEQDEVYRG